MAAGSCRCAEGMGGGRWSAVRVEQDEMFGGAPWEECEKRRQAAWSESADAIPRCLVELGRESECQRPIDAAATMNCSRSSTLSGGSRPLEGRAAGDVLGNAARG